MQRRVAGEVERSVQAQLLNGQNTIFGFLNGWIFSKKGPPDAFMEKLCREQTNEVQHVNRCPSGVKKRCWSTGGKHT